jgi:hypothetical protein
MKLFVSSALFFSSASALPQFIFPQQSLGFQQPAFGGAVYALNGAPLTTPPLPTIPALPTHAPNHAAPTHAPNHAAPTHAPAVAPVFTPPTAAPAVAPVFTPPTAAPAVAPIFTPPSLPALPADKPKITLNPETVKALNNLPLDKLFGLIDNLPEILDKLEKVEEVKEQAALLEKLPESLDDLDS